MAQEENTNMLELARSIAFEAHKGQQDKAGKDYVLHPIRVAEKLKNYCSEVQIVAYLHDTIEDTFVTPEFLKEKGFNDEIVEAVLSVTRKEGESYMEFIRRCAENPISRIVKTEDLKDNMDITRLNKITDEDIQRLRKYHKAYKYLTKNEKNII